MTNDEKEFREEAAALFRVWEQNGEGQPWMLDRIARLHSERVEKIREDWEAVNETLRLKCNELAALRERAERAEGQVNRLAAHFQTTPSILEEAIEYKEIEAVQRWEKTNQAVIGDLRARLQKAEKLAEAVEDLVNNRECSCYNGKPQAGPEPAKCNVQVLWTGKHDSYLGDCGRPLPCAVHIVETRALAEDGR